MSQFFLHPCATRIFYFGAKIRVNFEFANIFRLKVHFFFYFSPIANMLICKHKSSSLNAERANNRDFYSNLIIN